MSSIKSELQKEFELERMILFSDAVFAIAITLLIIEIKFPDIEKGATPHEVLKAFRPVIIRFAGFLLSFFFIGLMWARHLNIFKYLRSYNSGVIFRNLVLLFFIVCFPFTASGFTEHIRPGFYLPIYIYVINIACVTIAQFALCYYIFKQQPGLCMQGNDAEKKYILLQATTSAILLAISVVFIIFFPLISGLNPLYAFYIIPLLSCINRRYLKKHKPAKKLLDAPI